MKITSAESTIMDVLWDADRPLAAEEVREQLSADWSEATVRTFLTRLVSKKALARIKDGRRFLYRPLIERESYLTAESRGFLDRLFDGQISNFVAHFSERTELSEAEVAELKKLIERLGK